MKEFYIRMCCEYFNIVQVDATEINIDFYKGKLREYRLKYKLSIS